MVQPGQDLQFWIQSCDVWPFVLVAANATQCQITQFVAPAMLTRDNVIDHVRKVGYCFRKVAVLAPVLGTLPNKLGRRFVHDATRRREEPV